MESESEMELTDGEDDDVTMESDTEDNDSEPTKYDTDTDVAILNDRKELKEEQSVGDPVFVVQELLKEVIFSCTVTKIDKVNVAYLSKCTSIRTALSKARILNFVDVNLLDTPERATSFLINLSNLLSIHATLSKNYERLYSHCWPLNLIVKRFFGYNVGQFGFVTLYDIQSTLLNFKSPLNSTKFDSLKIFNDNRIIFTLALPFVCSPKIRVMNADNLKYELKLACNEYMHAYYTVNDELLVTFPMAWYLEETINNNLPDNKSWGFGVNHVDDIQKSLLSHLIMECKLPPAKVKEKDMYILKEPTFNLIFSYTHFDKEEMELYQRVLWKPCGIHKTVFCCIQDQLTVIESVFDIGSDKKEKKKKWKYCECDEISSDEIMCTNHLLLYFCIILSNYGPNSHRERPISNQYGCMQSVAAFSIHRGPQDSKVFRYTDDILEYEIVFGIFNTYLNLVPLNMIMKKIDLCREIIKRFKINKLHWFFDVFNENPNQIMETLVNHNLADMADPWYWIVCKFDASFSLPIKLTAKFINLLCASKKIKTLLAVTNKLDYGQIEEVLKYIMRSHYPATHIAVLMPILLARTDLSSDERVRYEILNLGINMICCLPSSERGLYTEMFYHPIYIIEQLLIDGKISVLSNVINKISSRLMQTSDEVQETGRISKSRIDELLRVYASKALRSDNAKTESESPVESLEQSKNSDENMKQSSSGFVPDNFIPPEKPPARRDWIPNVQVDCCMCCNLIQFTVFNRRHHCRRCGRIVCNSCSTHRFQVEGYVQDVRICDQCFRYESEQESKSGVSSCILGEELGEVIKWRITLNEVDNERIRQKFVYENTPSVPLCLSILELHSQHIAVPRFLFSRSEGFVRKLRTWKSGDNNVDYVELCHIARSLLLAAKVYYTKLGIPAGIQQCEELDNEIQLLNRLFTANFTSIISNRPSTLNGIAEIRRIRDYLLEQQQWNLALEISTKAGLECSGIWFAWGKTCLKNGDWAEAKEKFFHSSLDKYSSLLDDILQILSEDVSSVVDGNENDNSTEEIEKFRKIQHECIYYLRTYGTIGQLLNFYLERNQMKTALECVLEENVSSDIFLEKLYIPCLKNGDVLPLHQCMQDIDNSLIRWKEHLRIVCAYCDKNNYLKVLYVIQLWLKDYIRAAMTSIRFHLHGAHSYQELLLNIGHLHNACSHLEMAMNQTEKNEMIMTLEQVEIEKHLNTACLQIDVIKGITGNRVTAHAQLDPLPTLFGGSSEKCDVISLLFEATDNIKNAFTISHRLVTEYGLNSVDAYGKVSSVFVRADREDDIITLIKCIRERVSEPDTVIDKIIPIALLEKPTNTECLISHIGDDVLKISLYIDHRLLKSAYLLAVKNNRLDFVKRISDEAANLKMVSIQRICLKKLSEMKQT